MGHPATATERRRARRPQGGVKPHALQGSRSLQTGLERQCRLAPNVTAVASDRVTGIKSESPPTLADSSIDYIDRRSVGFDGFNSSVPRGFGFIHLAAPDDLTNGCLQYKEELPVRGGLALVLSLLRGIRFD